MTPRVVFWGIEDRPSSQMRGAQIAHALERAGCASEVRYGSDSLDDLDDAVIIAVKNGVPLRARRRNRIIFDAIDVNPLRVAHALPGCSAIIAPSEFIASRMRRLVRGAMPVEVIYHHADPRVEPHRAGETELRLVYVGETHNSAYIRGEIADLAILDFRNATWLDALRSYNAHFSARLDVTKSVVKLANAAASRAVFLGAREPGCVELLGTDYPYFLSDHRSLRAVRRDIERARETVGGPLWRDARARHEAIRERLSLDATVASYRKIIDTVARK